VREFLELTDDQAKVYCKGSEEQKVRKIIADRIGAKSVIDVGCGNGIDATRYAAWQYCGLDVSPALIKAAQEMHPNYLFMLGRADKKIPFSNRHFDCSIIKSVLEHVSSIEIVKAIINETIRVTNETLFIAWHTPPGDTVDIRQVEGHFGFTVHQNKWNRQDFSTYLERARSVMHIENFELWEIKT